MKVNSAYLLLLILSLFLFAFCHSEQKISQNKFELLKSSNYEEDWKKIHELEKKGLSKSILNELDHLMIKAEQEKNYPQIFKILAYKSNYLSKVSENELEVIFDMYEEKSASAEIPLKQMLHSALAEMYFWYYQQNRWKFADRSHVESPENESILSMDLKSIFEKTEWHYAKSLENPEILKQIDIDYLHEILSDTSVNKNTVYNKKLRPTLFDLLSHRALDFYISGEREVLSPASIPEIDENDFQAFEEFIDIKRFRTVDSSSLNKSLVLFRDLLKFHLSQENIAALVEVDLKRISFVANNYHKYNKDKLHLKALQQLKKAIVPNPAVAEVEFEIASYHYTKGVEEQKIDSIDYHLEKSHAICRKLNADYPNSHAADKCKALLKQIEEKNLGIQALYTYPSHENILLNIDFKNLDSLYFKVFHSPFDFLKISNETTLEKLEKIQKQEILSQRLIPIEKPKDFRSHRIDISLPSMKRGRYLLLVSNKANFLSDSAAVAFTEIWISDIAYLSKDVKTGKEIRSLNRSTGELLKNVQVEVWEQEYRPSTRKHHYVKHKTLITNEEGLALIPSEERYHNFQFLFIKGEDSLFSSDNYQIYSYRKQIKSRRIISHFFLDRAIYRPGQTVFFKNILIENYGDVKNVVKNHSSTIKLYNTNGKEVSSVELKSNEYGSMSGSFTLPSSGLKGQYRIADQYGSQYFSVEEYKRPKFRILVDSIADSYKLNEVVNICGRAQSYSGSNISNAELNYRIYRETYFPYAFYSRGFMPVSAKAEIASGKMLTDENGRFTIDFLALPDYKIDSALNPIFNFNVQIDVMDISGETQGTNVNLAVGYSALILSSNIPNEIFKDSLSNIQIAAENLSGIKIASEIQLSIYQLIPPKRIFKVKMLDSVDIHSIDSLDFIKKHPHLAYGKEDQIQTWTKGKKILDTLFTTSGKEKPLKNTSSWKSGAYYLRVRGKDKFGNKVLLEKYFKLFDSKDKQLPIPSYLMLNSKTQKFQVGDTAEIVIGSSLQDFKILYEYQSNNGIFSQGSLQLNNEQKLIKIPIIESYRGGVKLTFVAVRDNRAFLENLSLEVPFSNKKLNVSLNTFRDKLKPASQEEWSISIKNNKGEKVVGELLASMYDASLDNFKKQDWSLSIHPERRRLVSWTSNRSFSMVSSILYAPNWNSYFHYPQRIYRDFNWFGFHLANYNLPYRGGMAEDMMMVQEGASLNKSQEMLESDEESLANDKLEESSNKQIEVQSIRKNFEETVFFYPHIGIDKDGNYRFSFTMGDALTEWKFRALAHSKDLQVGHFSQNFISQKELMVFPNFPRFLRSADQLQISSRIDNLSKSLQSGSIELKFFDPLTTKELDLITSGNQKQNFEININGNQLIKWEVKIPQNIEAIGYRIVAKTENFSDGEENVLAVLPNKMLLTESMPISIRSNEIKIFTLEKLSKSNSSSSIKHHSLSLEFSSNPAWYAVQALPYLMESKYECSEQVFSRFFANSLASHIANSKPEIKRIFNYWKNIQPSALQTQLEKNQELKSILIEETPWLRDAENETERKKRLGVLFDLNRLSMEKENTLYRLQSMQLSNGGWPWFSNGQDDRFITQYILAGFGHLKKLGLDVDSDPEIGNMIQKGLHYLDQRIREDYDKLIKENRLDSIKGINELQLHYLYCRSFFPDVDMKKEIVAAYDFYLSHSDDNWLERPLFSQAILSMILHRSNKLELANKINKSLIENSIQNEEMGMYWKSNKSGYYWYQSAIETQALLIEAFEEVDKDSEYIEEMKIWLLKQKQVQNWKSTKATALACYALLLTGDDLLSEEKSIKISVGDELIAQEEIAVEAGTGYFKKTWTASEISSDMAKVEVSKSSTGIAWGALYWQYYEELNKITPSETALKLEKQLFIEEYTPSGPVIKAISSENPIHIGDKVIVRILLKVDRRMEYIHMKDMRASGMEPLNVLSSHQYQDGLSYYQSTSDASTNFFFSSLPKGQYIFEYALRASVEGKYSNGITSIQSMYAPEFSSHSEGNEVVIQAP